MILALLSDIHGNREALQACLIDAAARGAEQYVFLGDLVGYGADPSYVVETVARFAAKGAIVVKGNHDLAVTRAFGRHEWLRARRDRMDERSFERRRKSLP